MEITLIRHGKSTLTKNDKITLDKYNNWVKGYDNAGVFKEDSYPSETLEKIAKSNIVITSDLKRSIESAMLLNADFKSISDPLFRETELPTSLSRIGGLKLNPTIWTVLLRCLWFTGFSSSCESFSEARIRAKKAAEVLVGYAKEHKYVVLVGHGFFNMLVAKELQKMKLKGKRSTNSKHWNATTYTLLN
jgi:broad specificity phosphatase PhoE